jgi:UDPglucose 6-dehydrogenase
VTEWNEFKRPDFRRIKELLRRPYVFDGRNVFNPQRMIDMGFQYFCIGRE